MPRTVFISPRMLTVAPGALRTRGVPRDQLGLASTATEFRALLVWNTGVSYNLFAAVPVVMLGVLMAVAIVALAVMLFATENSSAFLASGGWCALNFWRCRQAHCLISGGGWLGLSFLSFIETGLGHSVINGYEQPVFLGVLAIGVAFEGTWYLRRGDNIVRFGATGQSTAR